MSAEKAKALKNAQKFTQKGQFDKAVSEYLKLIEVDPGEKTYKNFLGDLYLKQGNQEMAIRAFLEAASVYQSEGFTPHTIALYKKILRIDPHRMEIYQDLGKLYAEQGLVGDAITNFKVAADHFFARGQKQQALKTYKNIVDLDPRNLNVKLRLAELYSKEGMRAEAAAQYSGVAEKLAASGKADEAFGHYTRARELQPENVEALKGLISLCLSQERFQDAVAHMEALRGLEPTNVQNLLLLGKTFMKLGRRDAAIETFEKAVSADPAQLQVHETLGRLYLERADRTRAWNHLLPVIDTALNQNDRQTAGRLLDEFAAQLGTEKGFLQKQYEHSVQTGDPAKRLAFGKKLAAQYEENKSTDRALVIYRELVQIAPQDPEIGDRLRSLSAFYEPPPPIKPVSGVDSLEIDLEQIDLSDLQEFGESEAENYSHMELPLDLDLGNTPAPGQRYGTSQPSSARVSPRGSTPPPRKQELVDVDLSGLDLGEGFGVEPEHTIQASQKSREASRPPAWDKQPPPPAPKPSSWDQKPAPVAPKPSSPTPKPSSPTPKPAPMSDLDLNFDDITGAGLQIELDLPPAPPPRPPAPAFVPQPAPVSSPTPLSRASVLEELSASVDDFLPDIPIGETVGLQAPPGPPSFPASSGHEPFDFSSLNPAGGASKDPATTRRAAKSKPSKALDRLDMLTVPERPKSPDRARPPEVIQLSDSFQPMDPFARTPEKPRPSGPLELQDQSLPFEVMAPSAAAPRTDPPAAAPAAPPAPTSRPAPPESAWTSPAASSEMLDISTDFFTPKETDDSGAGLIDLGDLILGDQPVVSDDEENVNELLRQLREGIEAQVSKEDYDTHYNLGIAYKEMGLLDEAVDEFRRAAGDPARRVSCVSNIGLCHIQRGMIDEAIAEFKRGLNDPDCGEDDRVGLNYELGLVFEQLGDPAKATEAFRVAAKIDPNFRDLREKLRNAGGDTDLGTAKDRVSFL